MAGGVKPSRDEALADLRSAHLPAGEAARGLSGTPASPRGVVGRTRRAWPARRPAGHSRSNDCIVFSISSAAMSEVDWMPWILSLNSSGLLARRSASS